ncbi:MAG TPA: DUF2188 domain-containing protein [Acidimicrobiales bacterium]|nr:DUF2188 domain-containing protein [Acidimicrobiales bacterium]
MAARTEPAIVVEPRPDGRWAVQTDKTQRAAKLHDTQASAVADARRRAQGRGAELVVKGADGRIQSKDSHGRDDPYARG